MTNLVLSYNGIDVRNSDNGEMLNLTDMWKACGGDPNKRPNDWIRKEGAQFIEFIEENIKGAQGPLFQTEKGRNGSTSAHWQIAMAYAKYLSHKFHAHCNSIVRAHMEGRKLSQEAFQGQIVKTLETKFGAMLEEKIGQVFDQITTYRNDTKDTAIRLGERLDHIERHRHGLLSQVDATELRRQITEAAHMKIQLGDIRKPIAVYQEVDGMIRRAIDYPNQRGAKWDLCPLDKGTRAFSQIGMLIHSLSTDLAKKRAAEKKAAAEKQIEMFKQAVGA